MEFWGKNANRISIVSMAVTGFFTAAGGFMLYDGCNNVQKMVFKIDDTKTTNVNIGFGATNYGSIDATNKEPFKDLERQSLSYNDWINHLKQLKKHYQKLWDEAPEKSNEKFNLNQIINAINVIDQVYSLYIAGLVVTPILSVLFVASLGLFIYNKRIY